MNLQSVQERSARAAAGHAVWHFQEKAERKQTAAEKATADLEAVHRDNRRRRVDGSMSDGFLRELAHQRADLMTEFVCGLGMSPTRDEVITALADVLPGLDARPFAKKCKKDADAILARVLCPNWWARNLKRAAVWHREAAGRLSATTCARKRQPYLTDDTVHRLRKRDKAVAVMLEQTEIESEDGDVINIGQAIKASVANPAIRRGELMTRIKGCEEWADAEGWRGLFTTHTTPSRFHAVGHDGAINPRWLEAGQPTPKAAQAWLCGVWAKTRAALKNKGVDIFGFRVAEPHHDGTPHWHMLIFCRPEDRTQTKRLMRFYWLEDEIAAAKDQRRRLTCIKTRKATGRRLFGFCGVSEVGAPSVRYLRAGKRWTCKGCELTWAKMPAPGLNLSAKGIEAGAARHRFKAKTMQKGGAAGYCAKYISKGIDDEGDVGATGHCDDLPDGRKLHIPQADMFAGGAQRVRMWSRAHNIRQFQAIGQPPVTAWRELRRVDEAEAFRATDETWDAWMAVNRCGEQRASWQRFMRVQGGACVGRHYRIAVATKERETVGRYETETKPVPVGVVDRLDASGQITKSKRKEWKPRGGWVRAETLPAVRAALARPKAAQPWTRVNNCTDYAKRKAEIQRGSELRARFPWFFLDDWHVIEYRARQ